MLLEQLIRLAASRACWTAGRSNPTKTPMIAMTTSSSTSVNPLRTMDFIDSSLTFEALKAVH
jgi:hypothetical protein